MDQETVRTICYLARLEIGQNKSNKIQKDLETIIELIGGLIIRKINFLKMHLHQMMTTFLSQELLNEHTV
jgi:Asp-tRNA(Asn)/Glu-tRNA(Gln) amidotransferase C subunit